VSKEVFRLQDLMTWHTEIQRTYKAWFFKATGFISTWWDDYGWL